MATFDYSQMVDVANNLLTQFGNTFTLVKTTGLTYDATTKKEVKTTESYSGIAVKKAYSAEMIGNLSNIINMGDVSFICQFDDSTVVPTEGEDQIIFNSITYNVLHVTIVEPSGSPTIIYKLHTRRVK